LEKILSYYKAEEGMWGKCNSNSVEKYLA